MAAGGGGPSSPVGDRKVRAMNGGADPARLHRRPSRRRGAGRGVTVGAFDDPDIAFEVTSVTTEDGARLHVRTYGPPAAPVIVLVHGFACRVEYWNPQIAALSGRYRVIAYDQRGLGRSTLGSHGVTAAVLGDDLAAVLQAVLPSGRRAVLVGHSFGGITVMAMAQRHPDQFGARVAKVLLANTVAQRFWAQTMALPFAGRYRALRRPLLVGVSRLKFALPPLAVSRGAFRWLAMSRWADPAAVDFAWMVMSGCAPAVRVLWAAGLVDMDVLAGLDGITVPTTVVVGALDRLTPPAASQQIAEALTNRGLLHRLVVLPSCGHCSNLEAPAAFIAEIEDLVGR